MRRASKRDLSRYLMTGSPRNSRPFDMNILRKPATGKLPLVLTPSSADADRHAYTRIQSSFYFPRSLMDHLARFTESASQRAEKRCAKARAGRAEHPNTCGIAKIATHKPAPSRRRRQRRPNRAAAIGRWKISVDEIPRRRRPAKSGSMRLAGTGGQNGNPGQKPDSFPGWPAWHRCACGDGVPLQPILSAASAAAVRRSGVSFG